AISRGVTVWNELRVRKAAQHATRLNAGLGVDTTVDPQFDGTGFTLQFWDTRTGRCSAEARWHCFGEAGRGMGVAQEVLERLRRTHIVPPSRGQAWAAAVH
ncbi:MAG TPA: hypothetical protein VKA76_03695, partial [Gammaproteobacteria bacterium]|nr:hypothetical protein [Gammaproteobacteria bacterium]